MRKQISNQSFEYLRSYGTGRTYSELDLEGVKFVGCVLGQQNDSDFGLVVRDVTITKCRTDNCEVEGVRFESVFVDGLATKHQALGGCLFRNVTLKGNIGPIMTTPFNIGMSDMDREVMNTALVSYYKDVDWALDISRAEFSDADFCMVPGDLVRRDSETQFILRRDILGQYDRLPIRARIAASRFDVTPFDSIVAVVPRRSKNFAKLLEEFEKLRKAGLVE